MSTEIPELTDYQKPVQMGEFPEAANVRYAEDRKTTSDINLIYDTMSSHAETATLDNVYDSKLSILLKEKPSPSFANFPKAPSGLPIGVFKTDLSPNIGSRSKIEDAKDRADEAIHNTPDPTSSTIIPMIEDLLVKQIDKEFINGKTREFKPG